MRSLLIYPTHANIREELDEYLAAGIDAAPYPPRLTTGTEEQPANCWNESADKAEALGFPVAKTVCVRCKEHATCCAHGYLHQLILAKHATVAIATQQRIAHNGFDELVQDRDYLSLHEAPVELLRPLCELCEADLQLAVQHVNRLLSDPVWLDWFVNDRRKNEFGEMEHSPEEQLRRERLFDACSVLVVQLEDLSRCLAAAERTTSWTPAETQRAPDGLEWLLFRTARTFRLRYLGNPWRLILQAFTGRLEAIVVQVSTRFVTGEQGATETFKKVLGVRSNIPPAGRSVWFNDATLEPDRLQALVGVPVRDATPDGTVPLQKRAIQMLRDVTRQTSSAVLSSLLRAILVERPQVERLGLITHRPLLKALSDLEPECRERLARWSYFGSGDERSSNAWHTECDLIVIAGTPRVPPDGIAAYLLQVNEIEAVCRRPEWGTVLWHGSTEAGEDIRVEARGYSDDAWRRAHRDLVRAVLVQAIGRGRGILESGCDVVVLSTEECGLLIADWKLRPLGKLEYQVLVWVRQLTLGFPKRSSLGKASVSTDEVARAVGRSAPRVRTLLGALEQRGLVVRDGLRSGWRATEPADQLQEVCHVAG